MVPPRVWGPKGEQTLSVACSVSQLLGGPGLGVGVSVPGVLSVLISCQALSALCTGTGPPVP